MTSAAHPSPHHRGAAPPGIGPAVAERVPAEVARAFVEKGWWGSESVADHVARHAAATPEKAAYLGLDGSRISFAEYESGSTRLAATLAAQGLERGARVAVLM